MPAHSAASTSPTSVPTSSRSRTRGPAATSAATCLRTRRMRTRLFFETFNRNKRSISLDISTPGRPGRLRRPGAPRRRRVLSNLRGDVPGKLGLTYETLRTSTCASSAARCRRFGMTGPRATSRDMTTCSRDCGLDGAHRRARRARPAKSGLSLVDFRAASSRRCRSWPAARSPPRRHRHGLRRVSLFDTAIGMLTYLGIWAPVQRRLRAGPDDRSAHPSSSRSRLPGGRRMDRRRCPKEKFWHGSPGGRPRRTRDRQRSRASRPAGATPTS